jgi:hypothetical protein
VLVYECDAVNYATELMEDTDTLEDLPECLRHYFDFPALACDMQLNEEANELRDQGITYTVIGYRDREVTDMIVTTNEIKTLRNLLLEQLAAMRKAERDALNSKLSVYQARIHVLDKVIDSALIEARDELVDEAKRLTIRLQEGRY